MNKIKIILFSSSYLFSCLTLAAEAPAQFPLSHGVGAAANIVITLDDSNSMSAAFITTDLAIEQAQMSSHGNPLHYNPDITYKAPTRYTGVGANGSLIGEPYETSFTSAKGDGFYNGTRYNLATHFVYQYTGNTLRRPRVEGPGCDRRGTCRAHYYIFQPSSTCLKGDKRSTNNARCYSRHLVKPEEEQNYANWFSFYRTRLIATRSASNVSFSQLPENVRVEWQGLNRRSLPGNGLMLEFRGQHRLNFFKWSDALGLHGGTPIRRAMDAAGRYLTQREAYRVNGTDDYLTCRSNYHILMTDGYANGGFIGGDSDATAMVLPDKVQYTPRSPFADYQRGTAGDIAFRYWANNFVKLKDGTSAPLDVKPYYEVGDDYWDPRNNPATWPHVVQFMVGLGLSHALTIPSAPKWEVDPNNPLDRPTFKNLKDAKWPDAKGAGAVYDLWHAAINSRGEFFSAERPDHLIRAFDRIIERLQDSDGLSRAPVSVSGMQHMAIGDTQASGWSYQASFSSSGQWHGDVRGSQVTRNFEKNTMRIEHKWSAAKELNNTPFNKRWVYFSPDHGNKLDLQRFIYSEVYKTPNLLAALNKVSGTKNTNNKLAEVRVNFLLGDRSEEGKMMRRRASVLGDIINSQPVIYDKYRYGFLPARMNNLEGTNVVMPTQTHPMVAVGANDGMLHIFDGLTGKEEFAFIPKAVWKNLQHYADRHEYTAAAHRYYVDGSIVISDVYVASLKGWRKVLVGTTGAGGKGVFALLLGQPGTPIKVLFDWTDEDFKAANPHYPLGYTLQKPVIARLHDGWKLIMSNGYLTGANEKQALFVIDLLNNNERGSNRTRKNLKQALRVIPTRSSTPAGDFGSGIGSPKVMDRNGNGIAEFAYAGDLQGNLHRFDLRNNTSTTIFRAAQTKGKELIGQPITAAPTIVKHPSRPGYVIVVGTGRNYTRTDNSAYPVAQSVYGIWDAANSVSLDGKKVVQPKISLENLQERKVVSQQIAHQSGTPITVRVIEGAKFKWPAKLSVANGASQWDASGAKFGWYVNLTGHSEKVIDDLPAVNKTVFFQTVAPGGGSSCTPGADTWTYAVDAISGLLSKNVWVGYPKTPAGYTAGLKMPGGGGIAISLGTNNHFEVSTNSDKAIVEGDLINYGRETWRMMEAQ